MEDQRQYVYGQSFMARNFERVLDRLRGVETSVNTSTFGRVFRLGGCGHPQEIQDASFYTEIRAGLTTFATMAYIIAVNADILSETGGTCTCQPPFGPKDTCANEAEYQSCANVVKQDLITATAALSGLASILFGFFTNLPVALAPGMGLNAYFAYQVVGIRGQGPVPYSLALTAVFVEGFIFIILALTGMRHWLVKIIPGTIKTASGVGIGLFLTMVGMSYAEGIGIITGNPKTPLAIAGCDPAYLDLKTGACMSHLMTSSKMWLGIMCGGLLTAFLMAFRVKSAIIIGVALVSILSWPRSTPFTYFPNTVEGDERFEFFKKVVSFHPITHTLNAQQWDLSGNYGASFALALFTFLYVDIIDCTATLYSMARFCNKTRKGDGDFPRSTVAYCTDAACISIGSLLGCSPVTAFIESVNWRYVGDAIPSFVTIAFIPFSYSVAYGLIAGLFVYTALNSMIWAVMTLSRGSLEPKDYQYKEYWTWKPAGEKPWIVRVFSKGKFWEDERRRQHRAEDEGAKHHDEFAMSEIDLDSTRTSHIGTSFAASAHRASAMPSEGHREGSVRETHEMDVVIPQQVVIASQK
ncbi:inner membrane protein yieg [Diaporthe amygdali]|uniref:inner membrane protein yieg n=1 Tax=Phomopsis amygdali TaxID=1214568 RepID=UPI0022FDD6CC|nr:inner membrane protein yieg [Diaporthe amygdali]KAJ0117706.1 inner membrane protein yieg [Diaporthe amygdali]